MNKFLKGCSVLLLACAVLLGCQNSDSPKASLDDIDSSEASESFYEPRLDMNSATIKQEVTVRDFVDGDTVHFNVPKSISQDEILKARFLAVDTPESTGKIEEYGKAASSFTQNRLSAADSIIIESDTGSWNVDSTGDRYLVWVWYRQAADAPYRNLNVELLQNGLAVGSSSANNRYGDFCMKALSHAKDKKLNIFSNEKDPQFFYGDAIELSLKELRCNIESYIGSKVAFEGVVSKHSKNGVYVQSFDKDTGITFGIPVYYGFNLSGDGLDILTVGNGVRIVGTVSYYEAGQAYQISGISYRAMKPDDPDNIKKLSEGNEISFTPITADMLLNKKVEIIEGDEKKSFDYAYLAMASSVTMKNLYVKDAVMNNNKDSSSYGAMTLECVSDNLAVSIRTAALKDENGKLIGEDAYKGKNIEVRGIVDSFDGNYQIKVFSAKDIKITN